MSWLRGAAIRAALLCACLIPAMGAWADEPAEPAEEAPDPEVVAMWQAAMAASTEGPLLVKLRNQATIDLPAGYIYIPAPEAVPIMDRMGNQTDEAFLGLIFPQDESEWFATLDFESAGYIKDDDAKNWDADELLDNLREGTKAGNVHRKKVGVPPIEVTRWVQTPAYDAPAHRLVWSAEVREIGAAEGADPGINYNTYVLGREGYISLNLVTSASQIEAQKPIAHELLAAVSFNESKRYEDFNPSTDKVAAYGLAALIGGVAAKKLGLLAVIGAFVVKFAKVILIGVAGLGAGIASWFKRKKAGAEA